jgi:cholesterol oxidase
MSRLSRRDFLKGSAVTLGAFSLGVKGWARQAEPIEALVIGSGPAGAVAALRLAQAGVQTVVLERGIRWPINPQGDTFATFDVPSGKASWLSNMTNALPPNQTIDVFTGVLELIQGDNISVRAGAGWGGGSLVYNAITLIPRRALFNRVFRHMVDFDEMKDVFYPRAQSIIKAKPIPEDILALPQYESTRVNLQQATNAGFGARTAPLAVDWDIVRQEINGTKRPSIIDGQSWYGINSGAKNSADHNYLAMAEQTGHVQGLTLQVVTDIIEPQKGLFVAVANEIDTNGTVLRTRSYATRHLFLAAGSMGTSALMVKAKAKNTIHDLPEGVGTNWAGNGDFICIRDTGVANNAGTGGPAGHILIEDLNNPFSPTDMIELVYPKNAAFPGASLYVGLGVPPAAGFFTFDAPTDSVTVHWPTDQQDPRIIPFENGANSLVETMNAANPGSSTAFFSTNLTAHPWGGCAMGVVCDTFGRVKGHRGLYVVDGALGPDGEAPGVNPSFTIFALAERAMDEIIRRDLMGG